jgi:hypothetical protein
MLKISDIYNGQWTKLEIIVQSPEFGGIGQFLILKEIFFKRD